MTIPALSATSVANAYARTEAGDSASMEGFGQALSSALQGVVSAGHDADRQASAGIAGTGNLTDVVTAVNKAELALQTTTAIRDRVVQAYQDIMRMPI